MELIYPKSPDHKLLLQAYNLLLCYPCSLFSVFVIRSLESTITCYTQCNDVIVSVVELTDLSFTCSETPKTGLFAMRLINPWIIWRLNHYSIVYALDGICINSFILCYTWPFNT